MSREPIPLHNLVLPPFAAWDRKWFLLTAGENRPGGYNAMTVSWGGLGWLWGRALAMVVVRPTRHTYLFMEKCDMFSLCAFADKYRPVLQEILGKRSGRELDKIQAAGLTPVPLAQTAAPGFAEAELALACRKTYYHDLDPQHFMAGYIEENYRNDYHRVYFGEVLAVEGTPEYRRP